MNNYKIKLSCLYIEQRNYLSILLDFHMHSRPLSGSSELPDLGPYALFAKMLKDVSSRVIGTRTKWNHINFELKKVLLPP